MTDRTSRPPDGRLVVVAGRSRTGKSTYVARAIRRAPRVVVHDPKGSPNDYRGMHVVDCPLALVRVLKKAGAGPGRYRFVDLDLQHFDLFCGAALAWGRDIAPCVVVAEELADVTAPGKAPPAWGRLVRTGLGFGIDLWAVTQRPAESEKTSRGNASEFVAFHLADADDRKRVARNMDIDPALIAALKPLHYIRRVPGHGPEVGQL